MYRPNLIVYSVCIVFLFMAEPGFSEIYRYKDENGVWHYTDSPITLEGKEEMGGIADASGLKNIKERLFKKYNPGNQIEKASISTVTIKGAMGTASGFFISSNGHIITNKHVIRGDKNRIKKADKFIRHLDESFDQAEKDLEYHKAKIEQIEERLADYRRYIDSLSNDKAKERAQRDYTLENMRYQNYKEKVERKVKSVQNQKEQFTSAKSDYSSRKTIGNIQNHFKITIKDNTALYAYVLSVSKDHDLALLKVDGSITPSLKPNEYMVSQGTHVFAIGSPAGIRDNVTSGIVSGYDGRFIRTNAAIYPGNSGGPLVTGNGRVIGINTLKKITYKFEGIGYAIPIGTALSEFSHYLN